MHLHLASHLGMLDEPCEGHDIGTEPEDSVWWTVGGMTPDTHGRPHGLRPQGRPSTQDETLQG